MQVEAGVQGTGWLTVHPSRREVFASCALDCVRDFLNLPGVVVSGHVGRNVSRVQIGDEVCYLKREHRVRWRDRWRNLLDGFGPSSISRREADVLARLEILGLVGPICLASGEAAREAFLLVEEAHEAVDLRKLSAIDDTLASEIGRVIAEIHNAGIDQPDLFAKHFLVNEETGRITILDWQRASIRGRIPLRNRIRSLAALRATCTQVVFSARNWQALLKTYRDNLIEPDAPAKVKHSFAGASGSTEFEQAISDEAARLAKRPSIRRQLSSSHAEQELVRINGETVCAIPEVAKELDQPDVIDSLYDSTNVGKEFRFRSGRSGVLQVARYRIPIQKWLAKLRGKNWRSPELRTARLLFHLERHGILAPKLLAYGQQKNRAFCLFEPLDSRAVNGADRAAMNGLLHKLHDAGCTLCGNPFGMVGSEVVISTPQNLRLRRRLSRSFMAKDHARLDEILGAYR